jgi:hypothetical protein
LPAQRSVWTVLLAAMRGDATIFPKKLVSLCTNRESKCE